MLGGLDWLQAQSQGSAPPLAGLANTNLVGASGHSFGGQLSIVEAANDARIKAVIAFDPVEGAAQACSSAGDCPLASTLLPLPIPTGFVGETLDSVPTSSASQACAPPADNYMAFYMPASSPSYEVTVIGAGTASFVDSVSSCGLWCSLCAIPTAPQAQVLNVAYAYLVSFYERYLRNNMGYQSFLNGTAADQLFVNPGAVTLASK
jgi:hypothetical protein